MEEKGSQVERLDLDTEWVPCLRGYEEEMSQKHLGNGEEILQQMRDWKAMKTIKIEVGQLTCSHILYCMPSLV